MYSALRMRKELPFQDSLVFSPPSCRDKRAYIESLIAGERTLAAQLEILPIFGSTKADPVQFKRGSDKGLLKDKIAYFLAIFYCRCPVPERRKAACKTPIFISKKGPV